MYGMSTSPTSDLENWTILNGAALVHPQLIHSSPRCMPSQFTTLVSALTADNRSLVAMSAQSASYSFTSYDVT